MNNMGSQPKIRFNMHASSPSVGIPSGISAGIQKVETKRKLSQAVGASSGKLTVD